MTLLLLGLFLAIQRPASASGERVAATKRPDRDGSIEFTPCHWALDPNMQLAGRPIDHTSGLDAAELLKNISAHAIAEMNVQYKRVGVMGDGM